MPFSHSHLRASSPATRRAKNPAVFCIGWHAFVNLSQPAGQTPVPVPMTDKVGTPIENDLADGQEVEIVSWQPRSRADAAYQIRRRTDGREGWVTVGYLRRHREPPAPVEAPVITPS